MAGPEAVAVAGRHRRAVAQHAVLEAEHLERARVLRLALGGVVAARDEDRRLVAGRGEDLVAEDAGVRLAGLLDRAAERAVAVDAVHGDRARMVEGGQQIFAAAVDAAMDRARRQRLRLAVRRQGAGGGIDPQRARQVLVAGNEPGAAVARHHVEILPGGMRPDVLDVGRQGHRAALLQRGVGDVDVVEGKLRPDAGVEHGLLAHGLAPRWFGGCVRAGRAGPQRRKCATVDHGGSSRSGRLVGGFCRPGGCGRRALRSGRILAPPAAAGNRAGRRPKFLRNISLDKDYPMIL